MKNPLSSIRRELEENSDEQTRESPKRFFKEKIKSYGVKTPLVKRISKKFYAEIKDLKKGEIFNLCEKLWQSGYMEESFIACSWSYALRKKYGPGDFDIFETWVSKYVSNWAACDTLCNHTIGDFVEKFPEYISSLKKWALSENRWMRRASAVTLIIPARRGLFLEDIFEIADLLHDDKDDLVQKGYGWLLKSASQAHEKKVFDYVMSKKDTMPRTALRYAIEKMSPELKRRAMKK
jgi:3-methyladenine DNA glycosylase AlkD